MGQNSSCNDNKRNSYYDTGGQPGRLASGVVITDGAGGAIVRNPENISGAQINGTNVDVFFRRGARDEYVVSIRDVAGAAHALPEQYSQLPLPGGFRIVSAVDFSVNARTLAFKVEPL